ncbi:MAG TPA: hypothetical protein V6C81_12245 [Planktothrix sp.]|jgi:hypothetical protein
MIVDSTTAPLAVARRKLYAIAGGGPKSGDVRLARLTTAQRIEYFRSAEFRHWVADEISQGRKVFWLKDVDKTQAAGDVFTFFFWWRVANNKLSAQQLEIVERYLLKRKNIGFRALHTLLGLLPASWKPRFESLSPREIQRLWLQKEEGGEGIGLLDFWSNIYWPSQLGMTETEKLSQVQEFAPTYADRVFPGVPEENRALEDAGVHVVIVSNGDQELAIAASPILGVKPENVVGSHLEYDAKTGLSTGVNHSYEVYDRKWDVRPQPGKTLSFHYWLYMNRQRLGWEHIDEDEIVIAGRDGDSASSDGGMMITMPPFAALGNFMVDVPGEPARVKNFFYVADRYGWGKGKFFTLVQSAPAKGRLP